MILSSPQRKIPLGFRKKKQKPVHFSTTRNPPIRRRNRHGRSPPWESRMNSLNRKKRKDKLVRFSSLGPSLRKCDSPSRHFLEGNDQFFSWKSLFFYRCTDEISFAPLRSQGVAPRSNFIREKTLATAPPPCSPKSIYVLAGLVMYLSIESLSHDANAAKQARDSTPSRKSL